MNRDLLSALDSHELVVLRIIGEWLDLDLTGERKRDCISLLGQKMSQLNMELELKLLPPEEAAAVADLVSSEGKMPVAVFERQHGLVRQMGPGRMEREEPWLDPVSPAEALWYRGFIYRGFDEAKEELLEEFFYIPNELYIQLRSLDAASNEEGHFLTPVGEGKLNNLELMEARGDLVDDLTTIISSAQIKPLVQNDLDRLGPFFRYQDPSRRDLLFTLAWDMGLFRAANEGARPARRAVDWLKLGRETQLRELADSWRSCSWNELHFTPGLLCEGSGWSNDPAAARNGLISAIPEDNLWYEGVSLIAFIKENNPDFQRPGGNYDTWYIRDQGSGKYLRGFSSWDQVEGRLLQFLLRGPLYWLGVVRLRQSQGAADFYFQLTRRGLDWLQAKRVESADITVPIVVNNDATLLVPINANQYHRFQIARIAEAVPIEPNMPYEYWLTPNSLRNAQEQGIDSNRLLQFLGEASGRPIPVGTKRAIERWAEHGFEARIENAVILKVREAIILEKLRENPKTREFIAESLGDLSAVILPGKWQEFRRSAAQLGLLTDYSEELEEGWS